MTPVDPTLTPQELAKRVHHSLSRLRPEMTFEEYCGVFMGKAQLIENSLKGILVHKYGRDESSLEKYTMGMCIAALRKSGMRPDFLALLDELLKYRNYIAHEILADEAHLRSLIGQDTGRLNFKHAERAMYVAEEVIQVHDFLVEHDLL